MRHENILGLIGDTPLVGMHALSPNPTSGSSPSSRGRTPAARRRTASRSKMVELAEAAGELRPGDTILEPSSGNTGIGLAMVAELRGYRLRVVMPENVSIERRQLLEIFGAEIVLSPGEEGSNGAIRLVGEARRRRPVAGAPVPVRQPRQPARALRGDRPRDLARLPRGRRVRRRSRHERHADGRRPVPEGAEAGGAGRRGGAAGGRAGAGPAIARRRVRAADLRPDDPRPEVHRAATGVDRVAAATARRVRRVRRDLVGGGGRRRGEDGGADGRRARS